MDAHAIHKRAANRSAGSTPDQPAWTPSSTGTSPSTPEIAEHLEVCCSRLVLDSREVGRKLWHMIPGGLILGLPFLQGLPLVAYHLPALIVVATAILAARSFVHAQRFAP